MITALCLMESDNDYEGMAECAGCSRRAIDYWLLGFSDPRLSSIVAMLDGIGVNLAWAQEKMQSDKAKIRDFISTRRRAFEATSSKRKRAA